jgi:chromosome segregation ATPase
VITHLALENWRAYRSLDLAVEAGTTFLVAPNGVGKSSVLEAVRWALGGGHVETRPSMVRKGHTTATVAVTVSLPAGPLVVTRTLSVARARPVATTTATLAGAAVDEAHAYRLLEESWTADARFVSRTAFLTEDLRRDSDDPNLRAHLCRAYSLDDLQRAIAEIEPVLAALSKSLKASRAELSGTRDQLAAAGAEAARFGAELDRARDVVEAARAAHAEIRTALEEARAAAARHAAAQAWREGRDRLLAQAAPVAPDAVAAATAGPASEPLDVALAAVESRLGAEVEALRADQATLRARLEAAETALAALHEAGAACPVCLRELDDASRARAEDAHRLALENAADHLARLDEARAPAALDGVRRLAREAAALGPRPRTAAPPTSTPWWQPRLRPWPCSRPPPPAYGRPSSTTPPPRSGWRPSGPTWRQPTPSPSSTGPRPSWRRAGPPSTTPSPPCWAASWSRWRPRSTAGGRPCSPTAPTSTSRPTGR